MRLVDIFILSVLVFFTVSCNDDDSPEPNDEDTDTLNDDTLSNNGVSQINLVVDGNTVSVDTAFAVFTNLNPPMLKISLQDISSDISGNRTVVIDLYPNSFGQTGTYRINNFIDVGNLNALSHGIGSNVHNNVGCDSVLQETNGHYGEAGEVVLTEFNSEKVSGSFSMELCKGLNMSGTSADFITISGSFEDINLLSF